MGNRGQFSLYDQWSKMSFLRYKKVKESENFETCMEFTRQFQGRRHVTFFVTRNVYFNILLRGSRL